MREKDFAVSAAAFLALAVLYFFDDELLIPALIPAVIAHEAGHALFLRIGGARVRRMALDMKGLRMDYSGDISRMSEAAAILAGPFMGLLYAAVSARLGQLLERDFLLFSSGLSLALSLFNLIPARPLDGGRFLALLTGEGKPLRALELCAALGLMSAGLWALWRGYGSGLCVSGAWLLLAWGENPCKTA